MQSHKLEALIGTVVLIIAGYILWYGYTKSPSNDMKGYKVSAFFHRVDGLVIGSDVKMSGIKIGTVTHQDIDTKTFMAKVQMLIDPKIELPTDSSVSVSSESLLGGKYLDITPGGSEENIKDGGSIQHTQSALNLESLIGKLVFSEDKKHES